MMDLLNLFNIGRMHLGFSVLFICCVISGSVLGQTDPLDNFWKDVERRKAHSKKTEESDIKATSIIFDSCGAQIIVLNQDYVYEFKNKRYVRNEDGFYGSVTGIGIQTSKGILSSSHLVEPWRSDNPVLSSKGYTPIRTSLRFRSLKDSTMSQIEEGKYSISIGDHFISYPMEVSLAFKDEPVQPDSSGLLMLFYGTTKVDSFQTQVYNFKPLWKNRASAIDTQWLTPELLGGIFINIDSFSHKTVRYRISGLLSRNHDQEFALFPIKEDKPRKSTGKSPQDEGMKGTSMKKKKYESNDLER